MKFPLVVEADLDDRRIDRYHRHIDSDESGWHRRFTESDLVPAPAPVERGALGLAARDGPEKWLIHFYDEYGLEGRDFVLRNMYLHLVIDLPADDVDGYRGAIARGLGDGGWRCESRTGSATDADGAIERWRRGDLSAVLRHSLSHPEDLAFGVRPAEGYRALDVVVRNDGYRLPDAWDRRVFFEVFHRVGLRKKLAREEPRVVPAAALADHFPAQVELGCGPSIEAGIPHLSTLHRIYGVSRADYSFVFRAEDDPLLELFRDPQAKLREMTEIYRACLVAKPTPFYRQLVELWKRGFLVGPVITNNFDCQCADLGLPEISPPPLRLGALLPAHRPRPAREIAARHRRPR